VQKTSEISATINSSIFSHISQRTLWNFPTKDTVVEIKFQIITQERYKMS